jgi:hypothetical protein
MISSTKMGMMDSMADGGKDNDLGGVIQAIPKLNCTKSSICMGFLMNPFISSKG